MKIIICVIILILGVGIYTYKKSRSKKIRNSKPTYIEEENDDDNYNEFYEDDYNYDDSLTPMQNATNEHFKKMDKMNESTNRFLASILESQRQYEGMTISENPNEIFQNPQIAKTRPTPIGSWVKGEYRYFENYNVASHQISFGFPSENCKDKRVWVGLDNQEFDRINHDESIKFITEILSGSESYLRKIISIMDNSRYLN